MEHGARSHAKYSGSNAHRFPICTAQPALATAIGVDLNNADSDKGTEAHELLDFLLTNQYAITDLPVPHPAVHCFEAVQQALDYVAALRAQYPDLIVKSELYKEFPQKFLAPDKAAGIVDIFCYSPSARAYWVIDFKNGAGETVHVYQNAQLLFYGVCALWDLAFDHAFLVIIQPNSYAGAAPREWEITGLDLVEFQVDIENAIREAEGPDARLVPGEHCSRCSAGIGCLARERQAVSIITEDVKPVREMDARLLIPAAQLEPDRIGHILAFKDTVTDWLRDIESYAFQLAMRGEHVPLHKLVEADARRKWRPDWTPEKIAATLAEAGIAEDVAMPRKLIAMTSAEELVVAAWRNAAPITGKVQAAAEAKKRFATLTLKESSGKYSLVRDTDGRAPANRSRNDFAGVVPAEAIAAEQAPGFMQTFGGMNG